MTTVEDRNMIGRRWTGSGIAAMLLLPVLGEAAPWAPPPPGAQWRPPPHWTMPYLRKAPRAALGYGIYDKDGRGVAPDGYIQNSQAIVDSVDWQRMRTVTVELSEYRYSPSTIRLQRGVPYKLELVNRGQARHYFTAPGFFRSIATRKVQANRDGEIKAAYFTALEMMPDGGQLDMYFVPVRPGRYSVECTVPGHAEHGMVGQIIIE